MLRTLGVEGYGNAAIMCASHGISDEQETSLFRGTLTCHIVQPAKHPDSQWNLVYPDTLGQNFFQGCWITVALATILAHTIQ